MDFQGRTDPNLEGGLVYAGCFGLDEFRGGLRLPGSWPVFGKTGIGSAAQEGGLCWRDGVLVRNH